MPNVPILFPIKAGVSFASTDVLPKNFSPYSIKKSSTFLSQSGPGITSNKFRYLGGLKKCVIAKFFLKSSDLPSFISFIGIPEVLEVTSVPLVLCFSTKSKTVFLISNFSTTTSIIQSTSLIFSISSSKFPSVTLSINFLL